ncbi:MAG: S-layer homology domain-containing protein [Oscillospiraceae bacterium]|nr:S-layer homology domain-containing protein [Oscillospiraceae bacterium]
MTNLWKRSISLFLVVLTLMSVMIPGVSATEPTDLPASDSPMLYNTTDSSKMPRETASLTDVYGQIDTESANEIDSMFSDEAWARFAEDMDRILDFEPVEDKEAAPVLKSADHFVEDGGLQAYLKGGNLLMGSEVGLQPNKEEKVQVLGADTNAGAWVYVVDKDAMCFVVKDTDGAGIPNALVTISYLDDAGKRITKSAVATAGNTPGIAVFDDIPDAFFGVVDIQAEGYRSRSVLDKQMGAGEQYTYMLEPTKENDLYIRGVDLSGKDLMNEETPLSLMDIDTENLSLKVLVTKSGSASFPGSVEIQSANRGKTVLTISSTSGYAYDSNTRVYTAEKRWVEQKAGLLQDGDEVVVKVGGDTFPLENLTVKNAVFNQLGTNKTEMPVTTESAPGNLADKMGGNGMLNSTFQMLQVPVTVGFFPDGSMILMASYDITKLAPEMETKYSSLFQKSWNPKNLDTTESAFEVFERSFWENAEKVKGGSEVLNSADKIKCISNKTYNFSMSFSVFLRSNYNAETKDHYGTGGILFCGSFSGGVTEYFLFTAGPVVIPAYIGFEAGIAVKTTLNVSFNMDKPPVGEAKDTKWKYANNGSDDLSGRIEVIVSFSVFGGVGVKGVLGACATGYANMDIATVLGKGSASLVENPHTFIDVLYGMRIEYYLLFYTGEINLDCLQDSKRIYDSDWTSAQLMAEAVENMEFKDMDLAACAEKMVPALMDDGKEHDEYFILQNTEQLEGNATTKTLDYDVYPDTQIQMVTTKTYNVLFRICSNGVRTDIYYQRQDPDTGFFYQGYNKVTLPEGETRSVTEFVVVPNQTNRSDPNYWDKVYIGAIVADSTLPESERMRSTDVVTMVVDVDECETVSSVVASDPAKQGQVLYSAPMPAGRENYCSVAYAATYLQEQNGTQINSLKSFVSAVPTYTNYWISSCEAGTPEVRSYTNLGQNKICSNGVIAPNEPSYWQVNPYASSDKWLVMKGYGANGFYAPDLRCNIRVDIDGMVDIADISSGKLDFNSLVTNWRYLNGCNYFIAGDSVYWMNKKTSGSSYEWVVEKVQGGNGIVSVDNSYAMISNQAQSAIYIIDVVGDYDVDVAADTSTLTSNKIQVYTLITEEKISGKVVAELHGPLELKFAKGEQVNIFAAAYNPNECKARGLFVVYTTPNTNSESKYNTKIRTWQQNADSGMLVTDVKIPDYLVRDGQPVIDLYATVKNYGYYIGGCAQYTVYDETGTKLTMVWNGEDSADLNIGGTELYPGDSRVDHLQVRPNPNWDLNQEHEIIVDLRANRYNGDMDDFVNSAALKADNISFTARNSVIGDKHYVSTTFTNNTLIGGRTPIIQAVLRYADESKTRTLTFHLPTKEPIVQFTASDEDMTGQVYHYDIDMEPLWEDGLLGVTFSLVNDAGEQQSNEAVYVANPMENTKPGSGTHDCPSAQFADIDQTAWYHEAVDYAVTNGLMKGVADDAFDPNGVTTRAMLVTILYRMEGEPAVSGKSPFTDVKADLWYTDAIKWASKNGVVEGYGNGKFGPADTLSREQFATILMRYAKMKDHDTSKAADLSGYTDAATISAWAKDAMQWANAEKLIIGRTETTLVPLGETTRAEAAAILMRFQENT